MAATQEIVLVGIKPKPSTSNIYTPVAYPEAVSVTVLDNNDATEQPAGENGHEIGQGTTIEKQVTKTSHCFSTLYDCFYTLFLNTVLLRYSADDCFVIGTV